MIEKKKIQKKFTLNLVNLLRIKIVLGTRIIKRGGIGMFLWLTTQIQTQMIIY